MDDRSKEPAGEAGRPARGRRGMASLVAATSVSLALAGGSASVIARMLGYGDPASGLWSQGAGTSGAARAVAGDRELTPRDVETLRGLSGSLASEHGALVARWEAEGSPAGRRPAPASEILDDLSRTGRWPARPYPGWGDLRLEVRCAELAEDEVSARAGGEFRATSSSLSGDGSSCVVTCVGQGEGEVGGLGVTASVRLGGDAPEVDEDLGMARARRDYARERLAQAVAAGGVPGDGACALGGYAWPVQLDDGTVGTNETWWLYVDAGRVPLDVPGFVAFVDGAHEALRATAPEGTLSTSCTVIAVYPDDPALGGGGMAALGREVSGGTDAGGAYIRLAYPLSGTATDSTPCREEDLDGTLHPYSWDDRGDVGGEGDPQAG